MDFKSKKNWINPIMQTFATSGESGSGGNQSPTMFGQSCGESVIRYGAQCGIRTGTACQTRIGSQCLPRLGPSCMSRFGAPCTTRVGSECYTLPSEPLPPEK